MLLTLGAKKGIYKQAKQGQNAIKQLDVNVAETQIQLNCIQAFCRVLVNNEKPLWQDFLL